MEYKGFKIDVEKINESYSMFAHRITDNWILVDEFNPCVKNKKAAIKECKITIDDYYENPEHYDD